MRNHHSTETDSQTLITLRDRLAPYAPVLVAVTLGEAVFATGLWFRTTAIDAFLASSVVVSASLFGYRLLKERGQ
jgi:hypothetical protein